MLLPFRAPPAALVVLVLASCSAPNPSPAQQGPVRDIEYELFPTTRELAEADLAALTEVAADGTLFFASVPAALEGLANGEVLLAGISDKTPYGLLRVVLSRETDDAGALVLHTAAAPLQMAFRTLHARVADTTQPFASPASTATARAAQQLSAGGKLGDTQSYQVVVFDGDNDLGTKSDQVVIDTTLGGGLRFDLSIDVDWGAVEKLPATVAECVTSIGNLAKGEAPTCSPESLLPELKLTLQVDPYLDAELHVGGAATVGFSKRIDVATVVLPPIPVGPLVFLPSADVLATIEGRASARFAASAHANLEVESKVVLSSKVTNSKIVPFEVKEVDADAETPEVDLYAEASVSPGVRFVLALYGVVGPYAMVSAVASLSADPLRQPCWTFDVGLEAQLGVIVKTPSLPVIGAVTFLDWNPGALSLLDTTVASGDCSATPEGESIPPGGGPTAAVLQKPTFAPWATLLGIPADGTELASVYSYASGFPFVSASIDGRYVAGGGHTSGLLKLDGKGTATWRGELVTASDVALRTLGSVPSADAGLVTLFRSGDSSGFVLAKESQAGELETALTFDFPDECGATAQAIVRDGSSGFVVVGECPFLQSTWLVHLDAALAIVNARRVYDDNDATVRLTPTAITRSGDELVVAGNLVREGEGAGSAGFLVWLDGEVTPRLSAAFVCPAQLSFYPTAIIPSSAGSLTMVGDANGLGYVARIKPDGTLSFARFPNLGTGIQSGFAPNAVIELPSTGLVIAATVDGVDEAPSDVLLVGLDGNGHPQWGREYTLHGKSALRPLGWPSALLTDDGGLLITATAGPDGDSDGELFGMKVFARDGTLEDGPLITSSNVLPQESELTVEPRSLVIKSDKLVVTARAFEGMARVTR